MTVYQNSEDTDSSLPLCLASNERSFNSAKCNTLLKILPCFKPNNWKSCVPAPVSSINNTTIDSNVLMNEQLNSMQAWKMVRSSRLNDKTESYTFSGYNSLISQPKPISRVAVLPLLDASSSDLSTQLTFMKKFEELKEILKAPGKKVVVTLDMALYKSVKHLEMARSDCQNKWFLKPGELHIVIAQLRTIGSYIQNTGISELWVECGVYGTATTKQILDGNHVRRGIRAHSTTMSALYLLFEEEFDLQNPDKGSNLNKIMNNFIELYSNEADIKTVHSSLVTELKNNNILNKIRDFLNDKDLSSPTLKVIDIYNI